MFKKKKKKSLKKDPKNPYILEHMEDGDERIGSLVNQSETVKIDDRSNRIDVDASSNNEFTGQGNSVKINNRRN